MLSLNKHHWLAIISSFVIALSLFSVIMIVFRNYFQSEKTIPVISDFSTPTFIALSKPNAETSVEARIVAEKLNLERKLIVPSSPNDIASIEQAVVAAGGVVLEKSANAVVVELPSEKESTVVNELESKQLVESVEVDYPVYLTADQIGWGVSKIMAPPVWPTTKGNGVKVAVVDTGIDYTHPDFQGRYAGGYDFVNDDTDPFDDHGHGTHVAGIIAATDNNSGYEGVAPNTSVVAVKVLSANGTGYISDIVDGIDWAMNQGVQVMNFSLGTTYDSEALKNKVAEAQAKGIYLVGAAGNDGGGPLLYPAAYSPVISVAATDQNDNFAAFSNIGAEVAAPGVAITSTIPGGQYATWSGTSMAAPHVAATVALMIANKQTNIRVKLQQTALDLGTAGKDIYFGYGRIISEPAVLGKDLLAPIVTFTEPQHESTVAAKVRISLDIQDESGIKAATLSANNAVIKTWQGNDTFTYEWDASAFSGQTIDIIASAIDNADNIGAAMLTVHVKNQTQTTTPTSSPTASSSARSKRPNASPTATPSATPTAPVSQQSGESSEVRQDDTTPSQEVRQDTYHAPQELPPVSNYNQRNPQQSEQFNANVEGLSSQAEDSNDEKNNNGNNSGNSQNRGKPEVKGVSTSRCWWLFSFLCQ